MSTATWRSSARGRNRCSRLHGSSRPHGATLHDLEQRQRDNIGCRIPEPRSTARRTRRHEGPRIASHRRHLDRRPSARPLTDPGAVLPGNPRGWLALGLRGGAPCHHGEFLVVIADDPSGCEQDSRSCGQTFVVRCDDYWSHQYGTNHAILVNEARGPQERLTKAHFPARGLPLTLRVRRDALCDRASDAHGFDSDCVVWDCAPECCVLVAGSDVHDDRVIPLEELAGYGSLPCLRVEHEPAQDLTSAADRDKR